jgi:hypothetical protein
VSRTATSIASSVLGNMTSSSNCPVFIPSCYGEYR